MIYLAGTNKENAPVSSGLIARCTVLGRQFSPWSIDLLSEMKAQRRGMDAVPVFQWHRLRLNFPAGEPGQRAAIALETRANPDDGVGLRLYIYHHVSINIIWSHKPELFFFLQVSLHENRLGYPLLILVIRSLGYWHLQSLLSTLSHEAHYVLKGLYQTLFWSRVSAKQPTIFTTSLSTLGHFLRRDGHTKFIVVRISLLGLSGKG